MSGISVSHVLGLISLPFHPYSTPPNVSALETKPTERNATYMQNDASLNSGADTFMLLVEDFRTDLCEMKVMIWRGFLHLLSTVHPTYEAV